MASAAPARAATGGATRWEDTFPLGVWSFDDCSPERANLQDASVHGNTAFRALGVSCAAGVEGSPGVELAQREDLVYVPDQPSFTFSSGVTVAGWFRPENRRKTQTLLRKRDRGTSSFALVLHRGRFQFVIGMEDGSAISVSAPQQVELGTLQHVAGTYDGVVLRLYIDGVEVANRAVTGVIATGDGPLLMGNDGSERRFAGVIDDVLFAAHALTAAQLRALPCFPQYPTMTVSREGEQATPPGIPVTIDVEISNHSSRLCAPLTFTLKTMAFEDELTMRPPAFSAVDSEPVASGSSTRFSVSATPSELADPGNQYFFDFYVEEATTGFFELHFFPLTVLESTVCRVRAERELMITDVSVVDDPLRTAFDASSTDPDNGVWTFKHLMEGLAPSVEEAPTMVESLLESYLVPQLVNEHVVAPRPGFQDYVLAAWPRALDGSLDLARSPLRLQAIVNRMDLRDLDAGDAGELQFVFAFDGLSPFYQPRATLLLRYKLLASDVPAALAWAQSFHALGGLPFGEPYNRTLAALTERVVGRDRAPGRINASAFHRLHTNELDFGDGWDWQMRSMRLSEIDGRFTPEPLERTPDGSFNASSALSAYVIANQQEIMEGRHEVPLRWQEQAFRAGAAFNERVTWQAPSIDSELRHRFAARTCNGCHSSNETGTEFHHISPRWPGSEAALSGYLTGIEVADPVSGQPRTFGELARRAEDLRSVVCTESSHAGSVLRRQTRGSSPHR